MSEGLGFSLEADEILYRKDKIPLPSDTDIFFATFGKPDRVKRGLKQHVHIWDEQGIFAFQNKVTKRITGFGAQYRQSIPGQDSVRPGSSHMYSISVNGVELDAHTTTDDLVKGSFIQGDDDWVYRSRAIEVYAELNGEEGKLAEIQILCLDDEDHNDGMLSQVQTRWVIWKTIMKHLFR